MLSVFESFTVCPDTPNHAQIKHLLYAKCYKGFLYISEQSSLILDWICWDAHFLEDLEGCPFANNASHCRMGNFKLLGDGFIILPRLMSNKNCFSEVMADVLSSWHDTDTHLSDKSSTFIEVVTIFYLLCAFH